MVMNEALCVECRRLNDVASATPISSVDWMKIDVEGTEMDVLKGGSDVVEMASLIQFEFGGCNIDTRSFFRDYWDFFTARGFALYRLSPRGPVRVPDNELRRIAEGGLLIRSIAERITIVESKPAAVSSIADAPIP
jgi:hypothetical protein